MKKVFSIYSKYSSNIEPMYKMEILYNLIRISDAYGNIDDGSYKLYCEILKKIRTQIEGEKIKVTCEEIINAMEWLKYPIDMALDDYERAFAEKIFGDEFRVNLKQYLLVIKLYNNLPSYKVIKKMLTDEFEGEMDQKEVDKLYHLYIQQVREKKKDGCNVNNDILYVYNNLMGNNFKNIKLKNMCDFIITKGLITTPEKNNPYTDVYVKDRIIKEKIKDETEKRKKVSESKISKIVEDSIKMESKKSTEIFLNHFLLRKIKMKKEERSTLWQYIIERLTNVNLINKICQIFKEHNLYKIGGDGQIEYYDLEKNFDCSYLDLLAMYPLVIYRLQIIDKLIELITEDKYKNYKILMRIMKMIYYQTLFYFPIINMLSVLVDMEADEKQDDNYLLFEEVNGNKQDEIILEPINKAKGINENIYTDVARNVYRIFAESLTIDEEHIVDIMVKHRKRQNGVNVGKMLGQCYREYIKSLEEELLETFEKNIFLKSYYEMLNFKEGICIAK